MLTMMRTSNSHNIKAHYVGELERIMKEVVAVCFHIISRHSHKKTEKHKTPWSGMLALSKLAQSHRKKGQNS